MIDRTQLKKTAVRTLIGGLVAASIASAPLAPPAWAGGSISLSLAPTSARDARAMQTGLRLYSLFNQARSGAVVRQRGRNNTAGLGQFGRGNLGIVHQEGNGHTGTLRQNGDRNAYGLFQFGENTSGHVVQNGTGQSGATFQFGW